MIQGLRLRFFAHSWRSDWNHGNAHFLRGLTDELRRLGNEVRCYEVNDSWSLVNLLREPSAADSLEQFYKTFPDLYVRGYSLEDFADFAEKEVRDADVVVVHEWTHPQVAQGLLDLRKRFSFRLLLHDTHHRSYTSPQAIHQLRPCEFDGVLAFGEAVRRIYRELFNVSRSWTFHEAADTARFHPRQRQQRTEITWIGNWGDDERTAELEEFLLQPLSVPLTAVAAVYGVRYPQEAKSRLREAGIRYCGYLPNLSAPDVYARSALTLHIPRRYYSNGLSGIPTIRMFEAFACGVPLICSPWRDTEMLFTPGDDYLCVPDGHAMKAEVGRLLHDDLAGQQLASQALSTIQRRHTCQHRAIQFLDICEELSK